VAGTIRPAQIAGLLYVHWVCLLRLLVRCGVPKGAALPPSLRRERAAVDEELEGSPEISLEFR
jgi:hypothetical protein